MLNPEEIKSIKSLGDTMTEQVKEMFKDDVRQLLIFTMIFQPKIQELVTVMQEVLGIDKTISILEMYTNAEILIKEIKEKK